MDQRLGDSLSQRRVNMQLMAAFAGLALAAIGIYSVLSYNETVRPRDRRFEWHWALKWDKCCAPSLGESSFRRERHGYCDIRGGFAGAR